MSEKDETATTLLAVKLAGTTSALASLMMAVGLPADRDSATALLLCAVMGLQKSGITPSQVAWLAEEAAQHSKVIVDYSNRIGDNKHPTQEDLIRFKDNFQALAEKILSAFGDGNAKVGNA